MITIRCCCQPQKIIGYLRVDPGTQPRTIRLCVLPKIGAPPNMTTGSTAEIKHIYFPSDRVKELAIYSENRSVEFWRGVAGFIET